ncbi:MAG: phosphatidylinositol kinase [Microthrixaceae bacterium]
MDDRDPTVDDFLDATVDVDDPAVPALLRGGRIEVIGRLQWSSNATFLVDVTEDDQRCQAIYKPERGERPLHDFPPGLWRREIAAHRLSAELGWDLVPPTEGRDGPLGPGSLQYFVPSRFDEHYFSLRDRGGFDAVFRRLCAFDVVANNADRKGGHVLLGDDDRIWAIDHGLSFHRDLKLRTVIWDFAGDALDADTADDLHAWTERSGQSELGELLTTEEVEATVGRIHRLVGATRFPHDPTGRRIPWPLV